MKQQEKAWKDNDPRGVKRKSIRKERGGDKVSDRLGKRLRKGETAGNEW